jgi:hypothetical protein
MGIPFAHDALSCCLGIDHRLRRSDGDRVIEGARGVERGGASRLGRFAVNAICARRWVSAREGLLLPAARRRLRRPTLARRWRRADQAINGAWGCCRGCQDRRSMRRPPTVRWSLNARPVLAESLDKPTEVARATPEFQKWVLFAVIAKSLRRRTGGVWTETREATTVLLGGDWPLMGGEGLTCRGRPVAQTIPHSAFSGCIFD